MIPPDSKRGRHDNNNNEENEDRLSDLPDSELDNIKSLTVTASNLQTLSLVPGLFKDKLPSLLCNLKKLKVCSQFKGLTELRLTFDTSSNEDTAEESQPNTHFPAQDNGL
ncbi:hypothetical protein P8452_38482 [Trifolium repens]|nr:hypothetical protein P8452_38482 [Trifolium repens]